MKRVMVLLVVLSIASLASAADWTGLADEPYWDLGQNWSNFLEPVASDTVNINTVIAADGVTPLNPVIDSYVTAECQNLNVGTDAPGALDMTGGVGGRRE